MVIIRDQTQRIIENRPNFSRYLGKIADKKINIYIRNWFSNKLVFGHSWTSWPSSESVTPVNNSIVANNAMFSRGKCDVCNEDKLMCKNVCWIGLWCLGGKQRSWSLSLVTKPEWKESFLASARLLFEFTFCSNFDFFEILFLFEFRLLSCTFCLKI
jgi:hypothetical protein